MFFPVTFVPFPPTVTHLQSKWVGPRGGDLSVFLTHSSTLFHLSALQFSFRRTSLFAPKNQPASSHSDPPHRLRLTLLFYIHQSKAEGSDGTVPHYLKNHLDKGWMLSVFFFRPVSLLFWPLTSGFQKECLSGPVLGLVSTSKLNT